MAEARRFRVFVSSPSDVFGERERIERVIERLNGELGSGTELQAVRWEQTYYTADKTFQDQIILPSQTDLVICILWKRLGAELPPQYRRADGTTPTGTEFEFEEAMQAAKAKGTPDVLVYRKTAAVFLDAEHVELEKAQFEALKRFWSHWFQNESGHFTAAYESFESTDQFETLVEDHIRQWLLRNKADVAPTATWSIALKGSPFRGLQPFDEPHAGVFFGRRRAIEQIRQQLVESDKRGSPFLLLLGMSGSGKSSLARAGLVPRLTQIGAVPDVDLWRRCIIRPSEGQGDSILALARGLYAADVLPELAAGDCPTPADFATLLRSSPEAAARTVRMALGRAGKVIAAREGFDRPVVSRLLLVIDQFEEALRGSAEDRDTFGRALAALATQGQSWIIATLRSDFYAGFQASPPLVALRERGATFDLLPPSQAEIGQIVSEPAKAAGLRFEARADGRGLDEDLIAAADRPGSLPLLQLALDELFAARDPGTNVLPVAAYDAFGGLAGVVERRAEQTLSKLDPEAVAALPRVLSSLVAVSEDEIVTSRPAARAAAAATPAAGRLIDALVDARLLLSDDDHGVVRVRPAHDALIASWPRARNLLAADRDALRTRDRVEAAALRWSHEGESPDFLLPSGKPLAEALDLTSGRADQLSSHGLRFVDQSRKAEEARQAAALAASERELRLQAEAAHERAAAALVLVRRTRFAAAAVTLLLVIVGGVAGLAWFERGEAQRRALVAERNFASAMALAGQMSKGATLASSADHAGAVAALRKGLGTVRSISDRDPDAASWYVLQRANAQLHRSIGQIEVQSGAAADGMAEMMTSLDLFKRAAAGPDRADRQDDIVTTERVIAGVLFLENDKQGAVEHTKASVAAAKAAADAAPNNGDFADTLASAYRTLGDMLDQADDHAASLDAFEQERAVADRTRTGNPGDPRWVLQFAQAQAGAGFALRKLNRPQESLARFQDALNGFQQVLAKTPDDADVIHAADSAEQAVALGLEGAGDLPGALDHATAALARGEAMLAKNAAPTWTIDVAISQTYVGAILKQLGQQDQAREHFDRAKLLMTQAQTMSAR